MENFDFDLRSIQEARDLARKGEIAAKKMATYSQEQIEVILQNMVRAAEEHAVCLGKMAAEETGFGKVEDKAYKNHAASTLLYEEIKDMKTVGIIDEAGKTYDGCGGACRPGYGNRSIDQPDFHHNL